MAAAGLPLPAPQHSAALLPPTDILPRCSCQGRELAWRTQKAEGLEGLGAGGAERWAHPQPPGLAPGPSPLRTGSPLGRPLRMWGQGAGAAEVSAGQGACPDCPGPRGRPGLPSTSKESRSLSPAQHVHSAQRLKPRLF